MYNAFMQNTFLPISFHAATDLVVVGTNPEMADYDNPRGEIIRSAAYVVAEDAKGYRRYSDTIDTGFEADVMPKAERLAERLNTRLRTLGKPPVGFILWREGRPAYGSDAYIESDQGFEDCMMERMADEEMF